MSTTTYYFFYPLYTIFTDTVLGRAHAQIKQFRKGLKDTGVWPLPASSPDVASLFFLGPAYPTTALTSTFYANCVSTYIHIKILHGILCFYTLRPFFNPSAGPCPKMPITVMTLMTTFQLAASVLFFAPLFKFITV